MCGLQEYFDALEIKSTPPPRVVSALDMEGQSGSKVVHGGQERFAFESDFLLKHLRRVLNENWRRLPEPIAAATDIDVEVRWSEKAGAKRVVTDQPSEPDHRGPELGPALPTLPVGAAVRRAALSPAASDVGTAASGTAPGRRSGAELPPISTGPLVGGGGDAGAADADAVT